MHILTPENDFWNSLNKNDPLIPLIIVEGASCLYFLVKDVQEELESFILTGKTEATEFHVFEEEREMALIDQWTQLKLRVTYHSQQIEYMHHDRVTIIYLQVHDPDTGMSVFLIPWFMLPGRPYPVFVYIYAICHYDRSRKKSLCRSAAAAGKVFGIGKLNKSTVSRNIKSFENFIDITRVGGPLTAETREAPAEAGKTADTGSRAIGADSAAVSEMIGRIPEIIKSRHSAKALEEEYGETVKHLPPPINRTETARRAQTGIPDELFDVIDESTPSNNKHRDVRKRPARPRHEGPKCVQRTISFIDSWEIDKIRKEFIAICRQLALGAAIAYHRFLV